MGEDKFLLLLLKFFHILFLYFAMNINSLQLTNKEQTKHLYNM